MRLLVAGLCSVVVVSAPRMGWDHGFGFLSNDNFVLVVGFVQILSRLAGVKSHLAQVKDLRSSPPVTHQLGFNWRSGYSRFVADHLKLLGHTGSDAVNRDVVQLINAAALLN